MDRNIRPPPDQAAFDASVIPDSPATLVSSSGSWHRLCNPRYPSQFYASPGARLTPISAEFPCVYLAATKETSVAEIWADRFHARRAKGATLYSIPATDAKALAFLSAVMLPAMKLCDLTNGDVRLATGLEAGTIYTTDFKVPQTWAERIARHPGNFDGILYRSRLTDEHCLVLWMRKGARALYKAITLTAAVPFYDSPEAYSVAKKCGLKLSFP
jgi:RES domain-containing protein